MAQLFVSCRFAFGTGVVEYNRTIGQGKASSSAGSSRFSKSAREAQLEEETWAVSLNSKYNVAILTFHPFAGNDYSTRP
jgi:hypothetical protein